MNNEFSRTELLFGTEKMNKLYNKNVLIFGVGGVGGFTAEALARAGIGKIDVCDNDTISLSNINRQIIALHSTIGKNKVDIIKERILDINPNCKVTAFNTFYNEETANLFDFSKYDYIVDAIDTVSSKLLIIENAKKVNVPIISSMGTGNKIEPALFKIGDIFSTTYDPLAKVMRHELKKRNIEKLDVLYSTEQPIKIDCSNLELPTGKKSIPASNSFCPSVAGLLIGAYVIKNLIK